jgi:hypothetical protein
MLACEIKSKKAQYLYWFGKTNTRKSQYIVNCKRIYLNPLEINAGKSH